MVRQRARWYTAIDTTVPETDKPREKEGYSIERDITDFVEDYRKESTFDTLSAETTLNIINPQGRLTPTNSLSDLNYIINAPDSNGRLLPKTFAPIFSEGNEILIYKIRSAEDLEHRDRWIPKFRGRVKSVSPTTDKGYDSMTVVCEDILGLATKKPFYGTLTPIMRSNNFIPQLTWYTPATAIAAINKFRDFQGSFASGVGNTSVNQSIFPADNGEISPDQLSRYIWWDQEDLVLDAGKSLAPYYFSGTIPGEEFRKRDPLPPQAATDSDMLSGVWFRNAPAWLLLNGSATTTSHYTYQNASSVKLNGTLRAECTGLPQTAIGKVFIPILIKSGTISLVIERVTLSTKPGVGFGSSTKQQLLSESYSTPTTLNYSEKYGGTPLNPPSPMPHEWKVLEFNLPELQHLYDTAEFTHSLRVTITGSGDLYIDNPRLEFTCVDGGAIAGDKFAKSTAVDNNVSAYGKMERWTTLDGIIYNDPHPEHKILSSKQVRVIARFWTRPYGAGTSRGYGPAALYNRRIGSDVIYEKELTAGADFEILNEKGAIQLSNSFDYVEIFVAHIHYDIGASNHMEVSNIIKNLLVNGAGVPEDSVKLSYTGVKLGKIVMGASTSNDISKAIRDVLKFLPANYRVYADGAGVVHGDYVQQHGSPRLLTPMEQCMVPSNSTILTPGDEFWYGVSAMMPDGKETVISNIMSTVPYHDYYDSNHISMVDGRSSILNKIKSVPNQTGLVIRRAKSYKAPESLKPFTAVKPAYSWKFDGGTLNFTSGGIFLHDYDNGFTFKQVSQLQVV